MLWVIRSGSNGGWCDDRFTEPLNAVISTAGVRSIESKFRLNLNEVRTLEGDRNEGTKNTGHAELGALMAVRV